MSIRGIVVMTRRERLVVAHGEDKRGDELLVQSVSTMAKMESTHSVAH